MKMVVSYYLNFDFFIEVKAKSKYRILNFAFQSIKKNKTKWHFGYTDYFNQDLCKTFRSKSSSKEKLDRSPRVEATVESAVSPETGIVCASAKNNYLNEK